MLHCWSLSPELRPSFSKIVARLESLLQSSEDYLDMSEQSGQSGEQSGQLPAEPQFPETEFITSSAPFLSLADNSGLPDCGSVVSVVYQDDQYLQPLAEEDKPRTRQTTAFPNLSYQTVLFTGEES